MSSGRVGLKRYIIPITFDIFKPMWSMCLLHLRSEDIISPRKLNSDTLSMLIVLSNRLKKKILLVIAKFRQHAIFLQIYLCALF